MCGLNNEVSGMCNFVVWSMGWWCDVLGRYEFGIDCGVMIE